MDPREQLKEQIAESANVIRQRAGAIPEVAVVLGSGLGAAASDMTDIVCLDYADIPHFPIRMVEGHPGRLAVGRLSGKNAVVMEGRCHYYEGYTMRGITFPVRVMKELGAHTLIVTNAAGGINPAFGLGDLMVITDHINLMGDNPLIGPNDELLGPRFVTMVDAYAPGLVKLALSAAKKSGIALTQGVYAAVSGPSYETRAEIELLQRVGADAMGMSTVPEVIVARHAGLACLGLSCITNTTAGGHAAQHASILAVAERTASKLARLLNAILAEI